MPHDLDRPVAVDVDPLGNVYVAGYSWGGKDSGFDWTSPSSTVPTASSYGASDITVPEVFSRLELCRRQKEPPANKETARLESFSDNVFGIAMTILVLTIKVPTTTDVDQKGYLLHALAVQWPSYLTYAISFVTILLMWINHHSMFQRVQKADHALMFLNGLMLLPVTLVSFPTALLSVFIVHPQARFAAALFSGVYLMIAGFSLLVWTHITRMNVRQGIVEEPVRLKRLTRKNRIVFLLYLATFALAFLYPIGSVAACFLLAIYFALPELRNTAE